MRTGSCVVESNRSIPNISAVYLLMATYSSGFVSLVIGSTSLILGLSVVCECVVYMTAAYPKIRVTVSHSDSISLAFFRLSASSVTRLRWSRFFLFLCGPFKLPPTKPPTSFASPRCSLVMALYSASVSVVRLVSFSLSVNACHVICWLRQSLESLDGPVAMLSALMLPAPPVFACLPMRVLRVN